MLKPLTAEELCKRCDPGQFTFDTTDDLRNLDDILGQARALDAIRFGVGIKREGYNLYVLGPSGIGKQEVVTQYLNQQAAEQKTPSDWCYVNNFEHRQIPIAIQFPPGKGVEFAHDIDELIQELRNIVPLAFEADKYRVQLQEIEEGFGERNKEAFEKLAEESDEHDVALLTTRTGFSFSPMKNGKIIAPEDYKKLPQEERDRYKEIIAVLQEKLTNIIGHEPQWQREVQRNIRGLVHETTENTIKQPIDELREKYADLPDVQKHLQAMQDDMVANAHDFLPGEEQNQEAINQIENARPAFRDYKVNVLIDNSETKGAPVIYEDSPIYEALIGKVEHVASMGMLFTDFTLIKPGALHKANGGYLLLDAQKILMQPYAWEGLKRALFAKEVRIQSLGQLFSIISTVSLEPTPIPLDLKIVLMGDRLLYYLLYEYDPDFSELFKVAADFEDSIDSTPENYQLYAQMIATLVHKEELQAFDKGAVARAIEHGSRLVEDASKLSTHMLSLLDLLRESSYLAKERGHNIVMREDVQEAIDQQVYRVSRLRENLYEEIERGTILIDTDGEQTGQVNGLAIIDLSNFMFAQPARITATVQLGEGEVIDIEREVELGGAVHSKGVMILSAFLGMRYAQKLPLSLKASLAFEQSYGMIEGDSASMGELCTLLSALADIPIKQSLAITGSVNQHGQVQAIGGVNEKIEGFFDICKGRGLTDTQGVIIPQSNVKHLMLREDVIDAVKQGQFHVYPVENVDEAIELLTGKPAGELNKQGNYPKGSVNQSIMKNIRVFAESRHAFSQTDGSHADKEAEKEEKKAKKTPAKPKKKKKK